MKKVINEVCNKVFNEIIKFVYVVLIVAPISVFFLIIIGIITIAPMVLFIIVPPVGKMAILISLYICSILWTYTKNR